MINSIVGWKATADCGKFKESWRDVCYFQFKNGMMKYAVSYCFYTDSGTCRITPTLAFSDEFAYNTWSYIIQEMEHHAHTHTPSQTPHTAQCTPWCTWYITTRAVDVQIVHTCTHECSLSSILVHPFGTLLRCETITSGVWPTVRLYMHSSD